MTACRDQSVPDYEHDKRPFRSAASVTGRSRQPWDVMGSESKNGGSLSMRARRGNSWIWHSRSLLIASFCSPLESGRRDNINPLVADSVDTLFAKQRMP